VLVGKQLVETMEQQELTWSVLRVSLALEH